MPTFAFDGYPCHFTTANAEAAGAPLLLIHGVGGTYLHWPPHLRRLPGRPVHAIDLPGHGRSSGPGLATIADFVRLVAVWVAALEVDHFALGGHSMGSAIALSYALAQPLQVTALLVAGAGPRLPVNPALLALLQSDFAAATARITHLSYGPAVAVSARDTRLRHLRTVDPTAIYRGFVACAGFDATLRLREVAAPTLILAGADDRMTPVALAEELHAGIPHSTLQVLPATGHMIPIEQPAATTEAFAVFLDEILINVEIARTRLLHFDTHAGSVYADGTTA